MNKIKNFYRGLPKEIRVVPYLFISTSCALLISYLKDGDIEAVKDILNANIINILVIFMVESKSRAENLGGK